MRTLDALVLLAGLVFGILVVTGAWDWIRMAASYLAGGDERRELAWLKIKLRVLKWVAAEIGAAEGKAGGLKREGAGAPQGKPREAEPGP